MKINGLEVIGDKFAYDGCHKIYILEDEEDEKNAKECNYRIFPIRSIKLAYESSCELRFINNWKLTKRYVPQFEYENKEIIFEI